MGLKSRFEVQKSIILDLFWTVTLLEQLKMLAWLAQDGMTDSLCNCPVLWDSAGSNTGWVFSGTFWPPSPMWSSNKTQQPLHILGMLR